MFRRRTRASVPDTPQEYPSGTCVKTEKGHYFIRGGKRYNIPSERVLRARRFQRVTPSSEAAVANYKISGWIGFPDGTLIHNFKDGRMYLVEENKRRHIESPDVLDRLGATPKEVIVVSDTEIKLHKEGEPIS